jgi:GR25 family glycosyltransferase involved in LPS biosynthesis
MIKNPFGKIYAIHLDRHTERAKSLRKVFKEEDINWVKAIDNQEVKVTPKWLKENISTNFKDPNGWCTVGIICCALSHRKAWGEFLESGEETALFVEDDIYATPHAYNYDLNKIKERLEPSQIPMKWGVLWLGKYHNEIKSSSPLIWRDFEKDNIKLIERHRFDQFAAHSYVLTREAAQWYYDRILPINMAVDVFLEFSPFTQLCTKHTLFTQCKVDYKKYPDCEIMEKGRSDNGVVLNPKLGEFGAYTIEDGVVKDDQYVIGRKLHKYLEKVSSINMRQKYHNAISMFNLSFDFSK